MTDEQKAMCQAADEAADKLREQKTATQEAAGEISAQMGHITDLKDELLTLADASGKVKEKDQERVTFILNELNEALGTEYTMTDGVIQKYDELKNNINAVIQSKTANSLIDAANEEYVQAIEQEKEAFQRLSLAEQDYQVQLAAVEEAQKKYDETMKYLTENKETMGERAYQARKNSAKGELVTEQNLLKEKTKAYDDALADYKLHYDTINDYEEAQTAILGGNYERAIEILTDKGLAYGEYSDTVDAETAAVLDKLLKEAVDAGLAAEKTKKNFEKGVDGYTAEMVTEAENGYNKAMEAYANAYADAEGVGADLGDGLKDGMEGKRGSLLTKARSLVSGILSAMRKEADSNSPSKKTMDFGLDMGEGTEIGLEKSTKDILSTARKQVQSLLTTYRDEGEEAGPQVLQGVSRKALSRNDQAFQTYANSNVSKLDKILAAIERGQVLTIDGKALVGATADKTDSALGQKRALVARGAM
jgi:hypothetical protein